SGGRRRDLEKFTCPYAGCVARERRRDDRGDAVKIAGTGEIEGRQIARNTIDREIDTTVADSCKIAQLLLRRVKGGAIQNARRRAMRPAPDIKLCRLRNLGKEKLGREIFRRRGAEIRRHFLQIAISANALANIDYIAVAHDKKGVDIEKLRTKRSEIDRDVN